ncbi:MAG TPA: EAL domain-containing protein [Casimicrobiaceae bacterium]
MPMLRFSSESAKALVVRLQERRLRRPRETSIRQRLVLINLIATGVTFFLISLALVANEYLTHLATLRDELLLHAKVVSEGASPALLADDRGRLTSELARLRSIPQITQAAVFDPAGKLAGEFHAAGTPTTLTASPPVAGTHYTVASLDVTWPVAAAQGRSGTLRIEASLEAINRRLAWYAVVVALAGIAGLGIAVWLIDRMLVTASRPLRQLLRFMEIASSDKSCKVQAPVHAEDEVGALARGFNRMLKRIQERERDLKRELTERRRAEHRLAKLAHYDTVTRLPNRNRFNGYLTELLASARSSNEVFALLFVDLDNFKIVNDTLGHPVGDLLLKAVAARLRSCVRHNDVVSRLGGDEFTVILRNIGTPDNAGHVAEKLVAALASPFRIVGRDVQVSCSLGISLFPQDGSDATKLMKCGDMAMYHAKRCGRNNFQFFSPEMDAAARRRLSLETGLRRALEKGEFFLEYQPQIDIGSGELVGAEALIRWRSADIGVVQPNDFIPVAEDTGLIVPIGEWVLWTACSQATIWQKGGHPPVRVSVNLSARQFREPTIVRTIANVLELTGLDPTLLVLELTESVLLEDSEAASVKAQDLRAMGVLLAIDDFGTGYSSIGYLKRLPINEIKIDRSYVDGIPDDTDDAELAQAVIAMAHGLGIEIVAEGVETPAQLEFLAAHRCTRAQGHLIAAAMQPAAFDEFLGGRRGQPPRVQRPALEVVPQGERGAAARSMSRQAG